MKLTKAEKNLLKSLEMRKGIIDRFVLYPPKFETLIAKENNRAVIESKGDHLEFDHISESAFDYLNKLI
jgi:hypothetical protein